MNAEDKGVPSGSKRDVAPQDGETSFMFALHGLTARVWSVLRLVVARRHTVTERLLDRSYSACMCLLLLQDLLREQARVKEEEQRLQIRAVVLGLKRYLESGGSHAKPSRAAVVTKTIVFGSSGTKKLIAQRPRADQGP